MPEETLHSVFKQSASGLKTARQEAGKLKAINSTGRVDFVIQVEHIHPQPLPPLVILLFLRD